MKRQDLIQKGCLVPLELKEVIGNDSFEIFEGNEFSDWELLQKCVKENGEENTFLDFYYGTLTEEEQQTARQVLNDRQKAYLDSLELSGEREEVYFSYDSRLFEIAYRLSVTEMLFSSFYFAKMKKTLWMDFEQRILVISYGDKK